MDIENEINKINGLINKVPKWFRRIEKLEEKYESLFKTIHGISPDEVDNLQSRIENLEEGLKNEQNPGLHVKFNNMMKLLKKTNERIDKLERENEKNIACQNALGKELSELKNEFGCHFRADKDYDLKYTKQIKELKRKFETSNESWDEWLNKQDKRIEKIENIKLQNTAKILNQNKIVADYAEFKEELEEAFVRLNHHSSFYPRFSKLEKTLRKLIKELRFTHEEKDNRTDAAWGFFYDTLLEMLDGEKDKYNKPVRISFNIKELQDFLDLYGCDYCKQGWLHIEGGNIIFDWESNINHVITKHKDIELGGEYVY